MVVTAAFVTQTGIRGMRAPIALIALVGLVACAPAVPDSGVGFEDYSSYLKSREAELAMGGLPPAPAAAPVFSTESLGAAITAAEAGASAAPMATVASPVPPVGGPMDANRPRGDAPLTIQTQSGEMANAAGISDENDFNAVASRETIQSDAERLAQQRAQYEVIQPGALPQRTSDSGPNIVAFALSTSHAPGVPMYRRSSLTFTNSVAACANFASPDRAQEAFLAAGGPDRDRKNLDPDGDGYACSWDPRPFRTALQ